MFGATEAYQLLKLPLFVKHFLIHAEEDKNLTLSGFIKIHYLDPMVVDDDFDQDMQLPFKTHESDGCTVSAISMPIQKMTLVVPETISLPTLNYFFKEENYSFRHLPSIFQPPRVA